PRRRLSASRRIRPESRGRSLRGDSGRRPPIQIARAGGRRSVDTTVRVRLRDHESLQAWFRTLDRLQRYLMVRVRALTAERGSAVPGVGAVRYTSETGPGSSASAPKPQTGKAPSVERNLKLYPTAILI